MLLRFISILEIRKTFSDIEYEDVFIIRVNYFNYIPTTDIKNNVVMSNFES